MKNLKESILDDFDTISMNSESIMYLDILDKIWNKNLGKHAKNCDVLGRTLKVGDIVIYQRVGALALGIIIDINNDKAFVSSNGKTDQYKITYGANKGEISKSAYHETHKLIKIDLSILEQIHDLK